MKPLRLQRRLAGAFTIALLISLLVAPAALAFEVAGSEEHYRLGPELVVDDDLYVVAQTVTIDGIVRGDAVVAAQTIVVNGTIEGNLTAAAQNIVVNGTVQESARLAGQAVLINSQARIGRDVLFVGYSLEARPGSIIARDVGMGGTRHCWRAPWHATYGAAWRVSRSRVPSPATSTCPSATRRTRPGGS
jgi:cytoskeletal protein CcmA (bactofilin family)